MHRMTTIDSYHQLLAQRIRQQQKENEMADADMNVKVSIPVSVSRFLDAVARFLEPSNGLHTPESQENKPAEGPMTTGRGEAPEEFAVVHLHQSGRERWLHTSNKPSYGCDLSTYVETIRVRRIE